MLRLCSALALVALLASVGCVEEVTYVDPAVTFSDVGIFEVTGDPGVTLGLYTEQFFVELESGDELPIIFGFQGGTGVMPALRTTGFHFDCRVSGAVVTEGGERVGFLIDSPVRLDRTPDGTLDVESMPIPIAHLSTPEEPIDDLYGQPATLEVTVVDQLGTRITVSIGVVLVRG